VLELRRVLEYTKVILVKKILTLAQKRGADMVYESVQKASSWSPTLHKSKSSWTPQPTTVQTKPVPVPSSGQQVPSISPVASDWLSRDPVLQRLSSQETTVQRQCSKCEQEESVQTQAIGHPGVLNRVMRMPQAATLRQIQGQGEQKESSVQLQPIDPQPQSFIYGQVSGSFLRNYNDMRWANWSSIYGQVSGIFLRNYNDMRRANWRNSDRYFHCKANCQAAQLGPLGVAAAEVLSNTREFFDQVTGDPPEASRTDQEANSGGRVGGMKNPNGSCQQICSGYRPRGLPAEY
jgi:hypothetical protein